MAVNNRSYIQILDEEKENVKEAMAAEYGDPSRIAFGAYISRLAEDRLQEVSDE